MPRTPRLESVPRNSSRLFPWLFLLPLLLPCVPQALAAPAPDSGGILKCAVFERLDDVPFPPSSGFHSRVFAAACYEGLTRLDADGRVIAGAASDWYTDDSRIWRFQIAPGSMAHDGSLVTANDAKSSWEETLRTHGASLFAWPLWSIEGAVSLIEGTADSLAGVRIVSDFELEVELAYALPLFLEALARPSAWIACQRDTGWVGTGPFNIIQWQNGEAQLEAFASYRWGRPNLDSIQVISYSDAERGRAAFDFQAGALQMLWDAEEGQPIPTWVGLELDASYFTQSEWVHAARNAVDAVSLLKFRQLSGKGRMRFAGEPLEVHPAWQPYRPHKAYRVLQRSGWDEQQQCQLSFDSLPDRSGPSVARLLEAQLGEAGVQAHVSMRQGDTVAAMHLTNLSFNERHLDHLQAIPTMPPFLLLYEDTWHAQLSEHLRGWQLAAGLPLWDSLWVANE